VENKNFLKHKKFFAARRIDIENPAILYLISVGLIPLTTLQINIFNEILEGLSLRDMATKYNLPYRRVQNVRLYIRNKIPWTIECLKNVIKRERPVHLLH